MLLNGVLESPGAPNTCVALPSAKMVAGMALKGPQGS